MERKQTQVIFIIACSKWDIKHQKSLAISTENSVKVQAANGQFNIASINFVQEEGCVNLFTTEDNQLSVIIEVDTYKTTQESTEKK